ncbi:MAG: hypothetical protein Unbinned4614contig1000_9 [Prokaryotic dsDNA virus sp.]|nr:MAG: hypothetical protein Unbinned4614contig1000_9 [Prokaryotic dsDNA virus sp.]|tara:strand:- start:3758 stop:5098 length:1341 start_codon:yes stop_codon:yes gene_type:complete
MITSDSYIQNITDNTSTTENLEFSITFPVYNEDDVCVWSKATATGVLTRLTRGVDFEVRITGTTGTLVWMGQMPHKDTATIRLQRHTLRLQQDQYTPLNVTPDRLQQGLDEVAMQNQQAMNLDPLEPVHWSAEGDRISNLVSGSADADAVTKAQVDAAVGGGTSPFAIDSADVGKWATANSSGGYAWSTFLSTPDPKGQEYKYLTGNGWVDIDNLAPITGSDDNDKLLMDIDGTATWTSVNEWLTSFSPSVSNQTGKVYSMYGSGAPVAYTHTVRDYRSAPQLLEHMQGNRLTALQTGYDDASGLKNNYSRILRITNHSVNCSKKNENDIYYSGLGQHCDHPVYFGTIENPTGSTSAVPFFTSHLHAVNDDWFNTVSSGSGLEDYQEYYKYSFIFNIVNVTTTAVTFVAASLLHEGAMSADGVIGQFLTHPNTLTINFNVLWYLEK